MRGVLDQIRNPLVERQQNATFPKRLGHNHRIGRTGQVFVQDSICVVTGETQVLREIDRQIPVQLEFHRACKGISRSSCANSAA